MTEEKRIEDSSSLFYKQGKAKDGRIHKSGINIRGVVLAGSGKRSLTRREGDVGKGGGWSIEVKSIDLRD